MYTAQETSLKIKEIAKLKGITIKKMLSDCNLGVNYISQMGKGKQPNIENLKSIAEYLETTTDELLGIISINDNNYENLKNNVINTINGVNNGNNTIGYIVSKNNNLDEMTEELIKAFQSMSFTDKMDVMNYVLNKTKGE